MLLQLGPETVARVLRQLLLVLRAAPRLVLSFVAPLETPAHTLPHLVALADCLSSGVGLSLAPPLESSPRGCSSRGSSPAAAASGRLGIRPVRCSTLFQCMSSVFKVAPTR